MYGFSNEKIKRAIMELPGVHDAAPPPHRSARFSAASKRKDEKDTKSQNGDKVRQFLNPMFRLGAVFT